MTSTRVDDHTTTGTWARGLRPLTIAVLAMGGEGGGVLSNWIADTGRAAGWITQNTSVAGVAQRTGATVYYIELVPPAVQASGRGRQRPVLSTMPAPGQVDIVIASELMEAGRAVHRGFVTPDRTTLIASTNRVYSIDEKSGLGDCRVDSEELLRGARAAAKNLVSADFNRLAVDAGSVISASLFGAFAGSGATPFTRAECEDVIRATNKGVESSLRAFAAGFEAAQAALAPPAPAAQPSGEKVFLTLGSRPRTPEELQAEEDERLSAIAALRPHDLVGPALRDHADRIAREFPAGARLMLLRGVERTGVYQDAAYATRYLDRVARVVPLERDPAGTAQLVNEVARWTALWMCYQDTIQVAFQKVRRERIEGIRKEAKAQDDQPVEVREYLHPQLEEITDTLPVGLGRRLRDNALFAKAVHVVAHKGIVVNTTSVPGYTVLTALARLRPIRPRSLRFIHEQREIDAWLDRVVRHASEDPDLAREIACCARVLKGYGETWERGERSFAALLDASEQLAGRPDAASVLARLRSAALRDEDGSALVAELDATPELVGVEG
ncbi:indolepyruvate oxidoreductase subunit beta family protein [Granulicoccus sp. GXG6511]|uniref:indolepyruvate oxidoreductase subunit beta family protein n=1 Tax=Granulicoccus sp. GXG6511 TaxID=3381351 RepID=UPI003D7EB5F3